MRALLVAPPLDGPTTGGTLYNLQLMAAVDPARLALEHVGAEAARARAAETRPDAVWVDSLYLELVPQLRAALPARTALGVLLHYLPTLLQDPDPQALAELSPREQRALTAADMVVTPSATLRALVSRLRPALPVASIEPGVAHATIAAAREHTCVMVCNVTENKGVLPLLRALAEHAGPRDAFALRIAGRLDLEPAYAASCRALVAEQAWLSSHVRFLSGLAPAEVPTELARAGVFASASRMESYGMALAEARASGAPIVARAGGHVAHHVRAEHGGELVADEAALAEALLRLLRAPDELARRQRLAAANRLRRDWREAARELEGFTARCQR
jgi:hypothetical protein